MADHVKEAHEKQWQLKRRMEIFHRNSGSKYAPFSIEYMPHERQRLYGSGMTDEDRRLRRQYLKDQIISPDEPKEIPELQPRNFFRRVYGKPWDILFKAVTPLVGKEASIGLRWFIPKFLLSIVVFNVAIYHLTYNQRSWESISGWQVVSTKPVLYDGTMPPALSRKDYADWGFQKRKIFIDEVKTSGPDLS